MLIAYSKMEVVVSEVLLHLANNRADIINRSEPTPQKQLPKKSDDIVVIRVYGTLFSKSSAIGSSGAVSYGNINDSIEWAVMDGAKIILFDIASWGGEVPGLIALCNTIKQLPQRGVKTVGFSDSQATSAAFALLVSCQKSYVTETTHVASIGSICTLFSQAEADKEEGQSYEIVRSRKHKALYNPHETLSKEVIQMAQDRLNVLDTQFAEWVVSCTGVAMSVIDKLDGDDIFGKQAFELNLVTGLVTNERDVLALINADAITIDNENAEEEDIMSDKVNDSSSMAALTALLTAKERSISELTEQLSQAKAGIDATKAGAIKDERARIVGILNTTASLSIPIESPSVSRLVNTGVALEDAHSVLVTLKEGMDMANPVQASSSMGDITASLNLNRPFAGQSMNQASADEVMRTLHSVGNVETALDWGKVFNSRGA
jgi:ClpP class serine protease